MTRWKKELRKHGVKLESDYSFMPYDIGAGPTLEAVFVKIDGDLIMLHQVFVVGDLYTWYGRNFEVVKQDFR